MGEKRLDFWEQTATFGLFVMRGAKKTKSGHVWLEASLVSTCFISSDPPTLLLSVSLSADC